MPALGALGKAQLTLGVLFGGSHRKDWESILGAPYVWKLPHVYVYTHYVPRKIFFWGGSVVGF